MSARVNEWNAFGGSDDAGDAGADAVAVADVVVGAVATADAVLALYGAALVAAVVHNERH